MAAYFLTQLQVNKLWGRTDIRLHFNKDVNVLIGPNASGKTTILNILRYTLSAELLPLSQIHFQKICIRLTSFDGPEQESVEVSRIEDGFEFLVPKGRVKVELTRLLEGLPRYVHRRAVRDMQKELGDTLKGLVPAVWLPVSRRLPIPEEDEDYPRMRERTSGMESVDLRLREVIDELSRYRLGLEAKLSERYKEFERAVMRIILYSKQHDKISSLPVPSLTAAQKEHLVKAFEAARLMDAEIKRRIDEHFAEAEAAARRLDEYKKSGASAKYVTIEDLLIVPLIGRTNDMVKAARDLERDREAIFAPLHRYEAMLNAFLDTKAVAVDEKGRLRLETRSSPKQQLDAYMLSSGEKQIVILLTQALLWEDKPVVYVVDEPELSLHVTWQAKLLKSLQDLGGQIQIIVATHSPDIIGPFHDKVINLGARR
jgi:predicted ATP-dependent endonuclease of OLD family